jgi:hypothetical protein
MLSLRTTLLLHGTFPRILSLASLAFALGLAACVSDSDPADPDSEKPVPEVRGLPGCWNFDGPGETYSRLTLSEPDSALLIQRRVEEAGECPSFALNTLRTSWHDTGDSLVLGASTWLVRWEPMDRGICEFQPEEMTLVGSPYPLAYAMKGDDTLILHVPTPWYSYMPPDGNYPTTARAYTRCADSAPGT